MSAAAPTSRHRLAEIGALLAEPARAGILLALIDGSARPAGELAALAGVAPATASAHLQRLVTGGLLAVHAQGRHRYFRLAGEDVAHLVETLVLAGARAPVPATSAPAETPLRRARTCYRHLAGRLGVALFERLRERDALELGDDAIRLTPRGAQWLREAGLFEPGDDGLALAGQSCVDWTERRFHLAGPLGNRLAQQLFERGWLRQRRDSRALALGARGDAGLRALGIDWMRL
ncbi:MAG: ArsR/SmtB family transcription factor [Dokdonella sp.]|uniref:ArsR/SmtB family transcription factor n=1 Tax=Dokdonella sp. TaxID=2291710 RepID=UPI003F80B6D7